ncbi:MAG: hypothetical protein ACEY26_00845 [Candidatus Hodgkinia cicadicola]
MKSRSYRGVNHLFVEIDRPKGRLQELFGRWKRERSFGLVDFV